MTRSKALLLLLHAARSNAEPVLTDLVLFAKVDNRATRIRRTNYAVGV